MFSPYSAIFVIAITSAIAYIVPLLLNWKFPVPSDIQFDKSLLPVYVAIDSNAFLISLVVSIVNVSSYACRLTWAWYPVA